MSNVYGVKVPKVLGFMDGRVTYVIDRKATVRHIFRDLLNGSRIQKRGY